MATVPNPSQIVIQDWDTLQQNFTQNAQQVFCSAASDAGKLAILGGVTGAVYAAPQAFVGLGALALVGAAACGGNLSAPAIGGNPPPFSGGQCPVPYTVKVNLIEIFQGQDYPKGEQVGGATGPIVELAVPGRYNPSYGVIRAGNPPVDVLFGGAFGGADTRQWRFDNIRITRNDGQPDNCGSLPGSGGQIITNVEEGDKIDETNITNNTNTVYVIPVGINLGGQQITVNMPFSNVKVDEAFPLKFNVDIGGVKFHFQNDHSDPQNPILKPVPGPAAPTPTPGSDSDPSQVIKLLKEIKECTCSPDVELDMVYLPYVDSSVDCGVQVKSFLAPRGAFDGGILQKFTDTAASAVRKCEEDNVEQQGRTLLYSASVTAESGELFTPPITPEVVSLVLVVTEIRENGPDLITIYPAANQRKFGSVAFVLPDVNGGGNYIYIYDTETYIRLPRRAVNGRLRLLMRRGISFNVYDSGERLADYFLA
ncbi:MAG: hypothetical protein [Circular genetic element sp.]|nr:MAG: hypothetical protein [Circular genetic element sp.]